MRMYLFCILFLFVIYSNVINAQPTLLQCNKKSGPEYLPNPFYISLDYKNKTVIKTSYEDRPTILRYSFKKGFEHLHDQVKYETALWKNNRIKINLIRPNPFYHIYMPDHRKPEGIQKLIGAPLSEIADLVSDVKEFTFIELDIDRISGILKVHLNNLSKDVYEKRLKIYMSYTLENIKDEDTSGFRGMLMESMRDELFPEDYIGSCIKDPKPKF